MAKSGTVVKSFRPSVRKNFSLVMLPLILAPVLCFGISKLFEDVQWYVYAIVAAVALLTIAYAFFKKLFSRYEVRLDAVMAEVGLLSRTSSEIRIRDIRNITVAQSFSERLLNIGSVSYSSAAGDKEEVVFAGIADPKSYKRLIQELQDKLIDGAAAPVSVPQEEAIEYPGAAKDPSPDPGAKDELERLLAQQLAEQQDS